MRRILPFCALVALSTFSTAAFAERVIQNDSIGESVNAVVASADILAGEGYEAVFDIPVEYLQENSGRPLNFLGLRVLMVNGPQAGRYCGRYSVELYAEGMNPTTAEPTCSMVDLATFTVFNPRYKEPGAKFFDLAQIPVANGPLGFVIDGQPNTGNAAFTDLLVSAINMNRGVNIASIPITTARVRVVLRALDSQCGTAGQGAHFPILVTDQDGVAAPGKNFLYGQEPTICPTFRDYLWEDFGPAFSATPGDFLIRMILDYDDGTTTTPDAGMDMNESDAGMDEDMSVTDMSTTNNGTNNSNNGTNNGTNNTSNNATNNSSNNGVNNGVGGLRVTSISPGSASNAQNTDVVILGTGFEPGAEVSIGATVIGVTDTEPQRIRAVVPSALPLGTYDVIVTVPSGASTILANGFTVTTLSQGGLGDEGCGCGSTEGSSGPVLLLILGLGLMRRRRR